MFGYQTIAIKCCKNCPNRHKGCHQNCEIYAKEKEEFSKKVQWLKDKNYETAIPKTAYEKHIVTLIENPKRRAKR